MILGLTNSEAARAGWRVKRVECERDGVWVTLWKSPVDQHSVTVSLEQSEVFQLLEEIPWYGAVPLEVA